MKLKIIDSMKLNMLLLKETETMSRISTLKIFLLFCVLIAGWLVTSPSVAQADVDFTIVSVVPAAAMESVGADAVAVTVSMSGTLPDGESASATLSFSGDATKDTDYTVSSESVTFNASGSDMTGTYTTTVTISFITDGIVESDEPFQVDVSNTSSSGVIATFTPNPQTITIQDSDVATLDLGDDQTVDESDGSASFTVTMSAASDAAVAVGYTTNGVSATADSDYGTTSGTLTFAVGETSKTITVPITNDDILETASETFTVDLLPASLVTNGRSVSIGDGQAVGTITDNDVATLDFGDDQTVAESDGSASFTVTMSAASDAVVAVGYTTNGVSATADSDYGTTSGTLTFAVGETSKTITVPITNDDILETASETFTVDLLPASLVTNGRSVSIGDGQAVGTITDNDVATLDFGDDQTVAESDGSASFTVTMSAASDAAVAVGYTTNGVSATADSDYGTTSGTLTFAVGETSKTITVPITNDDILETASETFTVDLLPASLVTNGRSVSIGDGQAVGTITDNDVATLDFGDDQTVAESDGSASFTVTMSAASDAAVAVGGSGLHDQWRFGYC